MFFSVCNIFILSLVDDDMIPILSVYVRWGPEIKHSGHILLTLAKERRKKTRRQQRQERQMPRASAAVAKEEHKKNTYFILICLSGKKNAKTKKTIESNFILCQRSRAY
jgi:hypothetical protein